MTSWMEEVFNIAVLIRGLAVALALADGIWADRKTLRRVSWFHWFVLTVELLIVSGAAWLLLT